MENDNQKSFHSTSTNPSESLQKTQREFKTILDDFSNESHLTNFKQEYEKIYGCLVDSKKNNEKLEKKCKELKEEIVKNSKKVQYALQLSVDDHNTIYSLNQEIQKAWKMVEELHQKEKKSKETIKSLTSELTVLSKLVEKGMGIEKQKQKHAIITLVKEKEKLVKINLEIKEEVLKYEDMLGEIINAEKVMKLRNHDLHSRKKKLIEKIKESTSVLVRERENVENAKRTEEGKDKLILRLRELQVGFENELNEYIEKIERKKNEYFDEVKKNSTLKNSIFSTKIANNSLKTSNTEKYEKNTTLNFENKKKSTQVEEKRKQLITICNRYKKIKEKKDLEELALERYYKNLNDVKMDKNRIGLKTMDVKKEVDSLQDTVSNLKKEISRVEYEKNVSSKKIVTLTKLNESKNEELQTLHDNKSNVIKALNDQNEFTEGQKKKIKKLKMTREKQSNKTNKISKMYKEAVEANKMKRLENNELGKHLSESNEKLKDASIRYETVRRERNQYSKMFSDVQEEGLECKRNYSMMSKQTKHLREQIVGMERENDERKKKLKKTFRDIDKIKESKDKLIEIGKSLNVEIKNVNVKIQKVNESIMLVEDQRKKKVKELKEMTNQRDVLGTQLIRRNDELALLEEKIKIHSKIMDKGNVDYQKKSKDIRLLRLAILTLQRTLYLNSQHMKKLPQKEKELSNLMTKLKNARLKVEGISQILEDPKNKERWRTLKKKSSKGGDKSTFEIIKKTQDIQKRLIKKTEKLVEIEISIEQQKKLQLELKAIAKRQPTPEDAKLVNSLQKTLQQTSKRMKSLAGELNYINFEKKEKKFEIERLGRLIGEVKKQFFQIKRNNGKKY